MKTPFAMYVGQMADKTKARVENYLSHVSCVVNDHCLNFNELPQLSLHCVHMTDARTLVVVGDVSPVVLDSVIRRAFAKGLDVALYKEPEQSYDELAKKEGCRLYLLEDV